MGIATRSFPNIPNQKALLYTVIPATKAVNGKAEVVTINGI